MFEFLMIQWKLNNIDIIFLNDRLNKGQINKNEYQKIINTKKMEE